MAEQHVMDGKSDCKEDYDLDMPLNPENKLIQFLLRNKTIRIRYKPTLICLALAALTFLILSIAMLADMANIYTQTIVYYEEGGSTCQIKGDVCKIPFTLSQSLDSPIYVSYQLDDFFQNQRLFVQSKSNIQLQGRDISESETNLCKPYVTNAQMGVEVSWNGTLLDPNAIASPCGAAPRYLFNDTFSLSTTNGNSIPIVEEGITWPDDIGTTYRRTPDSATTQWTDPENQHFIVWMRTAGIPNFKKPWGIIEQPLQAGNYIFTVTNNYQTADWTGSKAIFLSTLGAFGGKNYLLPIIMLLVVVGCGLAIWYIAKLARQYTKIAYQQ